MKKEKSIQEVLKEIFSQSPIPNKLKKPKRDFEKGIMRETAMVRIVKEYSDYEVRIVCFLPV